MKKQSVVMFITQNTHANTDRFIQIQSGLGAYNITFPAPPTTGYRNFSDYLKDVFIEEATRRGWKGVWRFGETTGGLVAIQYADKAKV